MDKVNVKHVVPRGNSEMCDSDHGCEKTGSLREPYLLSAVPPTLVILSSQVTDCFSRGPSGSSPCYFVDRRVFSHSLLKRSIYNAGREKVQGWWGKREPIRLCCFHLAEEECQQCTHTHVYLYIHILIFLATFYFYFLPSRHWCSWQPVAFESHTGLTVGS